MAVPTPTLPFRKMPAYSVPAPVRSLVNLSPVEAGGGSDDVLATGWDASIGYEVTAVPSMRMVVDLGDLDAAGERAEPAIG